MFIVAYKHKITHVLMHINWLCIFISQRCIYADNYNKYLMNDHWVWCYYYLQSAHQVDIYCFVIILPDDLRMVFTFSATKSINS